jgi:hypothetical protein
MEKLFDDSLFIQKDRPTQITSQQEEEMYAKFAEEIIDNDYSKNDAETIIKDLKELSWLDSGFEKAQKLYSDGMASYEFSGDFIDWLDDMKYERDLIIKENVKLWVKAHNPKPKLEKGAKLEIVESLGLVKDLRSGTVVYVTGFNMEEAYYTVSTNPNKKGGYVIAFEKVELNCSLM